MASLCVSSQLATQISARSTVRRSAPVRRNLVVRAGDNPFMKVNNPDKVAEDKRKRDTESAWAEPKNKNPLEKATFMRTTPGSGGKDGEDAVEGIKDKVEDVVEGVEDAAKGLADSVKDAAKKVTGQD